MKPTLLCSLFSLLLAFASMPAQADTGPTTAPPNEVMTEDPSDGLACTDHADALVISFEFEADAFLAVYDLALKPASVGPYGHDLLFGHVQDTSKALALKPHERIVKRYSTLA